ncbi:MAG: transposase [Methylococcus sp.]|nr:MAG: transposase [Methylococcus sp.]
MEDDGTATTNKRKLHSADFKAKVALEVVRGLMTINEVGQKFEVHPMMVRQWKKAFLEKRWGRG